MTYLNTDRQTEADLSITEGVYDEYPLYTLFSDTETKNGRRLMLSWVTSPLNDLRSIQERQEAIAWHGLPELPLDEEELDFIEYYLEYRDQIKRPNALASLTTAFDRLLRHDPKRYVIKRGVILLIRLINRLDHLWKEVPENAPSLLKEWAQTAQSAIHGSELKEIIGIAADESASFSIYMIDKYDYLFRAVRSVLIRELLSCVYTLDVCRTAQRVALSRNFCCRPKMVQNTEFSITGFVHPFIKEGQTNDWEITDRNICIFTGSNMAGKSTTLKAITLTVWLAHCGLPVPARAMVCPVFDGIYTSINLPDSLRDGRSHFMAEVLRIKEVLQQAKSGKRCLIVLDEMFRGTNAQDAFEASVAVNNLLKRYRHCAFLISTHIMEYAKSFEKDGECCFYYMDSKIENNRFVCPYRLLKGISEAKVGYWLVKKELEDLI